MLKLLWLPLIYLKYFPEERSQCFKIGTEVSEHISVNHGVPQSTVVGPLIYLNIRTPKYLLHVNYFSEKIKGNFELVQFADDTIVLFLCKPGETIATKIESIVLYLNADKIELLYFSTRHELEPKVTFNGNLIKSAESCRYSGFHLDAKFDF